MMNANSTFVMPTLNAEGFSCPNCGAFAQQRWEGYNFQSHYYTGLQLSRCEHCAKYGVWLEGTLLYPAANAVPEAHTDTPPDCKADFDEARDIFLRSPRGAAALLRLAIQKLMVHLGLPGSHIDSDIKTLVQRGLPIEVQKALDASRVIGNNAVHPGAIDLTATPTTALAMFGLFNFIIEDRISRPKQLDALYASLPAAALAAIEKRDSKS